jgi:outer membrane protein
VIRLLFLLLLLGALAARADEDALQRAFAEGMQAQQAGELSRAESIFRGMLQSTDSPRVKLELARTLFLQGKYPEAKRLFKDVSLRDETPWRVRDNIALFVREIEERTGYLKFGFTAVSDSNPGNVARQKEFSIGDLRVTPTEAPKKMSGLRYSAQGWLPLAAIGSSGYATASYVDYPEQDFDRLTVDAGLVRNLTQSGRLRGKAGLEFGTQGGNGLYRYPYLGLDALLAQSESSRLAAELRFGRVLFPDFDYLDATYRSAAFSYRHEMSHTVAGTLRATVEGSRAEEKPYSYYGWDFGPGISTFWPQYTFLVGASFSVGARKYAEVDPVFGQRREDERARAEVTVGNKKWRWRDNYVALVASVEDTRSNIGFYSYRKSNVSLVVE